MDLYSLWGKCYVSISGHWLTSPVPPSLPPRHALPLFTSLLNVVCAYDPVGYGIPYNYLLSSDQREQLVVHVIQVLIIALEHEGIARASLQVLGGISATAAVGQQEVRISAFICFTMVTKETYIVFITHK